MCNTVVQTTIYSHARLVVVKSAWLGPKPDSSYAGGFLHTDDIRTLAISMDILLAQATMHGEGPWSPDVFFQ